MYTPMSDSWWWIILQLKINKFKKRNKKCSSSKKYKGNIMKRLTVLTLVDALKRSRHGDSRWGGYGRKRKRLMRSFLFFQKNLGNTSLCKLILPFTQQTVKKVSYPSWTIATIPSTFRLPWSRTQKLGILPAIWLAEFSSSLSSVIPVPTSSPSVKREKTSQTDIS